MSLIFYFFFLLFLGIFLTYICVIISKKSQNWRQKFIPFECGYDHFSFSRTPFSMRFFLIAIIFIIFDVEIALILPITESVLISNIWNWFMSSSIFFFIIIFGTLLEWKENSFDWKF